MRFEVRITRGGVSARMVPISGTVTWKSDRISRRYASNSSSARSISSMSRTGRDAVGRLERLEERPADQEVGAEDVVRGRVVGLAARLEQPDLEHLARVVPLVDGGVDVEPLVALEADQPRAERRREDLGQLGLADARPRPRGAAGGPARAPGRRPSRATGRRCSRASGSRPGWPRSSGSRRGGLSRSVIGGIYTPARPAGCGASRQPTVPRIAESPNRACAEAGRAGRLWRCTRMARGRGTWPRTRRETKLSVLRTEDVPLQEVSGVCLRREAGGDMALVAFGDRTSIAAWVELPSRRCRRVRLADRRPGRRRGVADPARRSAGRGRVRRRRRADPHPPGVATAGRAARLGRPHGGDPDRARHPGGSPAPRLVGRLRGLAGRGRGVHAERPPADRQGEGPGRLHRVRPGGRRAVGVRPRVGARGRGALADRRGRSRVRPARGLEPVGQAAGDLRGLQRPRGRPRPAALPAERQVPVDRPGRRAGRRATRWPAPTRSGSCRCSTASRRASP